jgi:hypothetical protein
VSEERNALVCARVADLKRPTPGSIQSACGPCGAAVWVSVSGQRAFRQREHTILCVQCSMKVVAADPDVRVEIAPGAMEELRDYRRESSG